MLKEPLKSDNFLFINRIKNSIPQNKRSVEEVLNLLKDYVDYEPCKLEEAEWGQIQAMKMNCAEISDLQPEIKAYKVLISDKNRKYLNIKKESYLLVEHYFQEIDAENNTISAVILLLLGYDKKLKLSETQKEKANNILVKQLIENL